MRFRWGILLSLALVSPAASSPLTPSEWEALNKRGEWAQIYLPGYVLRLSPTGDMVISLSGTNSTITLSKGSRMSEVALGRFRIEWLPGEGDNLIITLPSGRRIPHRFRNGIWYKRLTKPPPRALAGTEIYTLRPFSIDFNHIFTGRDR